MLFYIGLHHPNHAKHFERCMISVMRLLRRKSVFEVNEWILDSGAFSQVFRYGEHTPVEEYARQVIRWAKCGRMVAAVSQDYMCEPFILARTGATVEEHQRWTIERYLALRALVPSEIYIMPVLQGFRPKEYVHHVEMYGKLLPEGTWVGVGSVCKRNSSPGQVLEILWTIKNARPDLRLHGFGLKVTALAVPAIRHMLYSADSMAWSYAARRDRRGRAANDWREAMTFVRKIEEKLELQRQLTIYEILGGMAVTT